MFLLLLETGDTRNGGQAAKIMGQEMVETTKQQHYDVLKSLPEK